MKFYSFSTIKDEQDIIESFVRYNLNILDGMVISDNGSNDNTYKILENLKKEGLNIILLQDKSRYFDQTVKRNELLDYTFKNCKPDIVFPLDADEFISAYDGVNPRRIIEKLDMNNFYKYKFENFVLTGKEDKKESFVPKKMTYRRIINEEEHCDYKCFITKKIYSSGISLEMGAHDIVNKNERKIKPQVNIVSQLFLAHFPVRSEYQLMNKVITGRLNNSSLHSRKEGLGFHQYEILDEIKEKGTISKETLHNFSKYYSVMDKSSEIREVLDPINISFCKNLQIKYIDKKEDNTLLSNTLKTSETIIDTMREREQKAKTKYEKLEMDNKSIKIEMKYKDEQIDRLKEELDNVYHSKSWRVTAPLRKFMLIVHSIRKNDGGRK